MTAWQLKNAGRYSRNNNFDELLEKVIRIRRPIFSDGYGKSVIMISLDELE